MFSISIDQAAVLMWALINEAHILSLPDDEAISDAQESLEFSLLCVCEDIIEKAMNSPVGEA